MTMSNRAYSLLEIKGIDDEKRVLTGIASTPTVDRQGDIVEPKGAQFKLPIPFLWQHDARSPVGSVTKAKVTIDGIEVEIKIQKTDEPGLVKDRLDAAWQDIKLGLVRGLSIGFAPIETAQIEGSFGLRFLKWLWLELSGVTVAANGDCSIQTIKSIDTQIRAASGISDAVVDWSGKRFDTGTLAATGHTERPSKPPPGVTGKATKPVKLLTPEDIAMSGKKTVSEQISEFEATRQVKAARMAEIQSQASDEGRTKDESEKEEFKNIQAELKAIDDELVDLREMERTNIAHAKAVNGSDTEKAAESRGSVRVEMRDSLPKGTMFTRYVMAMAAARGAPLEALEFAKRWDSQTPQVSAYIKQMAWGQKADVGTTYGPSGSPTTGWGSALVYQDNLAGEFVELLRAATVVGRINGFRRVPFNVRIPVQTGGSTVNWVGEGAAKPVSELEFSTMSLTFAKIAGIVVLTDELVRLSSPSAEATVRQDLVAQVAQFIDEQFLLTSVTETTDRPASVTNGVTPVTASGTDADAFYADLNDALASFDAVELSTGNLWMVMPTALARGIGTLRNALGQFEFSGLNAGGGNVMGFQVLVSNSAPAGTIVLIKADEIFLADDGAVTIDASNQATLDMAGGNSPTFSLWQKNCIGVRAERWIRWKKRRAEAVAMISSAAYGPA